MKSYPGYLLNIMNKIRAKNYTTAKTNKKLQSRRIGLLPNNALQKAVLKRLDILTKKKILSNRLLPLTCMETPRDSNDV